MARDTTDARPITHVDELIAHIAEGEKPASRWRLGTEHEKFPFTLAGHDPVPYEGERGIRAVLEGMQAALGWEPITDEDRIIGLAGPPGQGAISLEPGGQFELSGAAVETLHETLREAAAHLSALRGVAGPLGLGFLALGGSPKWTLEQTPAMPKSRYRIMTRYMPEVGTHGLDMMYRTATIQVNLDFASEADMAAKMRVGMKLQSLATALFANSPFTDGRLNGFQSWRGEIWRDTDNARAGLLPFAFSRQFGYGDYVAWALDVPMYFVIRDGHYHDMTGFTFRRFMGGAARDAIPDGLPTMGDWTNHLSTLFPDVRLKRFLEMRGADNGPLAHIAALPAFWVGLLYDRAALDGADRLTAAWTFREVQALRDAVPVQGLDAPLRGRPLREIAAEVLALSRAGLKNRARRDAGGADETGFLDPLDEIVSGGQTAAEVMAEAFRTRWGGSVEPAFDEYAY